MRPSGLPSLRNEAEALTRPGCRAQKERLLAQRRVCGLCPLPGPLPATLRPALLALRPRGSRAQTQGSGARGGLQLPPRIHRLFLQSLPTALSKELCGIHGQQFQM